MFFSQQIRTFTYIKSPLLILTADDIGKIMAVDPNTDPLYSVIYDGTAGLIPLGKLIGFDTDTVYIESNNIIKIKINNAILSGSTYELPDITTSANIWLAYPDVTGYATAYDINDGLKPSGPYIGYIVQKTSLDQEFLVCKNFNLLSLGTVSGGISLASNGLSLDTSTVILGGDLDRNTTIDGVSDTYSLTFENINLFRAEALTLNLICDDVANSNIFTGIQIDTAETSILYNNLTDNAVGSISVSYGSVNIGGQLGLITSTISVSSTGINLYSNGSFWLRTPNVIATTAKNNQVLTLIDETTGQAEYSWLKLNVSNVLILDETINTTIIDSTGGVIVVLPAIPYDGQFYNIKDSGNGSLINTITINGNGNNIDNSSTYLISNSYESVTIVWSTNYNQWFII